MISNLNYKLIDFKKTILNLFSFFEGSKVPPSPIFGSFEPYVGLEKENRFRIAVVKSIVCILHLKSRISSEAHNKIVKLCVLLKNALYINQHSMMPQLGVFLKSGLYIDFMWQITPYANPRTIYIYY